MAIQLTGRALDVWAIRRQAHRPACVGTAMQHVADWNRILTGHALTRLADVPGITIYGPRDPARRTSLVAFNVAGHHPMRLADELNLAGVESRAGCHCATLAHHALGLTRPPAVG
jgi:cysteine desulfurase / selenocysteine lyase